MRKKLSKILVTGGAGFIGSAFVRMLVKQGLSSCRKQDIPRYDTAGCLHPFQGETLVPEVVVVDSLTYAGDLERLREIKGKFKFYKTDICNKRQIERIFSREKPDAVLCFAAETHVDRSIQDAAPFIKTNIEGTRVLLDACRRHKIKKYIQISTDEVYGEIRKGKFLEESPLRPNSPYAASKASADLLVKSYVRTYNLPAIIIRPSNNYGPWQYPEKLIPLAVLKILRNEKVPIYARGENVREWLYVEDCACGILDVLEKGRLGEIYNIGSDNETKNIKLIKYLLKNLKANGKSFEFVKDRPGHDIRYRIDSSKIKKETGWRPRIKLNAGLVKTINWSLENKDWLLSKHKDIARLYKNDEKKSRF